ncbi:MAG: aminotransferase class I/II-fold pyridoxal phosphate-dependent enzyme [Pseudomonadales bacterium]|nr:aminotransferase class I/II-fold pyridoxal phosphate-dependent enzyme [Pseudomonadales bacterium]
MNEESERRNWRPETRLNHDGEHADRVHGAVIPPLYQNSTHVFDSWDALDAAFEDRTGTAVYGRQRNPTVAAAEAQLAALAGAERARLFGSGMGAISSALLASLRAGDHLVTIDNVYGPAARFMDSWLAEKAGVSTSFVRGSDPSEFEAALTPRTRVIYLESPSSAKFGLQDIAAIAEIARPRGIRVIIDNTWATPLNQRPLELGADLEIHSASKYLGGHSDLIAGVLLGRAELVDAIATMEAELLGARAAPFEAWLLLRGLRTLPARMAAHERGGLAVARFLEGDARIAEVLHPGLPSHPQHALAQRQMSGSSSLFAFTLATDDVAAVKRFFDSLVLFRRGVSWGGHESLVYSISISALKEYTPERFAAMGLRPGDMRVSVGLEHPDDLIADLAQALDRI